MALPDILELVEASCDFLDHFDACRLTSTCRRCVEIFRCEILWKEMAERRWKDKLCRPSSPPESWRDAFREAEIDSRRCHITAAELTELVFDMRFWRGVHDGERGIIATGLAFSASPHIVFRNDGTVQGHPYRDDVEMTWDLLDDGAAISWGFMCYTPRGVLGRTQNWGWEIWSPNAILRTTTPHQRPLQLYRDLVEDMCVVKISIGPGLPARYELPTKFFVWLKQYYSDPIMSCINGKLQRRTDLVLRAGLRPSRH